MKNLKELEALGVTHLAVSNGQAVAVNPYEADKGRRYTAWFNKQIVLQDLPPLPCHESVKEGTYPIGLFSEQPQAKHPDTSVWFDIPNIDLYGDVIETRFTLQLIVYNENPQRKIGEDSIAEYVLDLERKSKRNWPEDSSLENGNYNNICHQCNQEFIGHKRRVTCKICGSGTPVSSRAKTVFKASSKRVFTFHFIWLIGIGYSKGYFHYDKYNCMETVSLYFPFVKINAIQNFRKQEP